MGTVRPAGGTFCDWRGFVAAPAAAIDAPRVLAAAGLASLRFEGAPPSDRALAPFGEPADPSYLLDLSGGFETYARPAGRAAPKSMANFRRATRKLEADGRETRFILRDARPETLAALIALKSEQYRRTRHGDLLAWSWSRRLVDALHASPSPAFEAVLSSLCIDGRLAAVHLGLRSGAVVHHWMPAYTPEFRPYMPGHLLTLGMARAFAAEGVTEMDLGASDVHWKREFANASAPRIRGVVHADSPAGRLNAAAFALGRRWAELPLGPAARLPHKLSWRLDRGLGRFAPPPAPQG
jgi:CelD/BcsL family acetyltransferase involved in cellulose biosynthesis